MSCIEQTPAWVMEAGILAALLLGFFAGRAYTWVGQLVAEVIRRRREPVTQSGGEP